MADSILPMGPNNPPRPAVETRLAETWATWQAAASGRWQQAAQPGGEGPGVVNAIRPPLASEPVGDELRREQLDAVLRDALLSGGVIEHQVDFFVIIRFEGAQPSHVLHLLLSLFTAGLWLPVWLVVAMSATGTRRWAITVDECGAVDRQLVAAR